MQENKVLITGAAGLLGNALLKLVPTSFSIIPTYYKNTAVVKNTKYNYLKLNIKNKKDVTDFFKKYNPSVVIHAASIGNVDFCEKNKKEAFSVNVKGTANIIEASKKTGAKLIFTSSNAVFDGLHAPYAEESKTSPVNYYGVTKVLSEEMIQKQLPGAAIVRLVLMYGWNHSKERQNPVTWLLNELKNNNKVKMVNDTYNNPLLNLQAAQGVWNIITKNKKGIFHLAGKDRVNRYEFALTTAEVFGFNKNLIEPVKSTFFKGIAQRMPDTTYVTTKMEKELLIKPLKVKEGLLAMKSAENFYL